MGRKARNKLSVCLFVRLTFHTEFGAPAVFVDENKKDEEEDAGEARQTHGDGNLREKWNAVSDCVHIIILRTFLITLKTHNHTLIHWIVMLLPHRLQQRVQHLSALCVLQLTAQWTLNMSLNTDWRMCSVGKIQFKARSLLHHHHQILSRLTLKCDSFGRAKNKYCKYWRYRQQLFPVYTVVCWI